MHNIFLIKIIKEKLGKVFYIFKKHTHTFFFVILKHVVYKYLYLQNIRNSINSVIKFQFVLITVFTNKK